MKSLFVLCLLTFPLACQQDKSARTMHRIQSGTPDSTGWITADSSKGHFSVRVPIPFNDFTVEETDPSVPAAQVHTVGCKSSEGIKFIASKITYKEKGYASSFFAKAKSESTPPTISIIPVSGYPFADSHKNTSSSCAIQRVVLAGEFVFLLVAEWPNSQESLAKPLAKQFLESLKIEAVPAP